MQVLSRSIAIAAIAQLGERQTEDLKVPGSIPGLGKLVPYTALLTSPSSYSVRLAHDSDDTGRVE